MALSEAVRISGSPPRLELERHAQEHDGKRGERLIFCEVADLPTGVPGVFLFQR